MRPGLLIVKRIFTIYPREGVLSLEWWLFPCIEPDYLPSVPVYPPPEEISTNAIEYQLKSGVWCLGGFDL